MKKRQTVSALLLLAALCSALVSCGGGDTDGVSTKAPDAPSSQAEEATTGLADIYGIVSADMGGEELVILTGEHAEYEYMIEKENSYESVQYASWCDRRCRCCCCNPGGEGHYG